LNHATEHPSGTAGRGLQLLLLATAMAIAGYVRTAISPLQEAMRIALSLSDTQMALLQGPVIGIPVTLTAIPLGLLIDRYSRVRLLAILVVLSLVGSLLTALAPGFNSLLLARCLAGLTSLGILPVVFSLLADHYAPARRGRMTTVVIVGQVVGNSAAFALGGTLLAMTGIGPDGWRLAMLSLVIPLVPVALLMLALREPLRKGVAIANPSPRQVWDELRRFRAVIGVLAIGIVLVETALGGMLIWGAPMLSRKFGLPPNHVGTIMAIAMLASGILGPIVGGVLADVCHRNGGPHRTISALSGLALLGAPAGLFAFVPGVIPTSVLFVAAWTVVLAVAVMGMTLFTIVIPNELRGLCMSLLMAAILLFALAIAPVAVSLLSGALGGLEMIGIALSLICVTTSLVAAATFALGRRYIDFRAGE
jgi:MFS family permease